MAIVRRIIRSLFVALAGYFGGIGVEKVIGQDVPAWVLFLLAAIFGILAFLWEKIFAFAKRLLFPPRPLSKLQKDIVIYLGGISSGAGSFQATMERLGLDYFQEKQVGQFNAELVPLKKQNILRYESGYLQLTADGWNQYFALSKTVGDQH
jgi:hypothetical protein